MTWWKDVHTISVEHFVDIDDLVQAEWSAIDRESPKYNPPRPTRKQIISVVRGDGRPVQREAVSLPFPGDVLGETLASDDATLLTRGQVAAYLQVSVRTVDGWKADGTLPYVNLGSASRKIVRFALSDVDRLIHRELVQYDTPEPATRKSGLLSRFRKVD